MARNYFLALKIINALVFTWLFFTFLISIFDFNVVITTADNEFVIFAFFGAIKDVFSYLIYGVGLVIALGVSYATAGYNPYMQNFIETFFERFLSSWFTIGSPTLTEIPTLMLDKVGVLFNDVYLFAFQILILISVIYAIRAFFNSDPKNHLIALGSLIFMTVLPLIITGLYDMLELFNIHFPILTDMADPNNNPLNPSLFVIPLNDFFQFISSPVIGFAIISYIYLELAFQVNYTDTVTKPSLQRSDRLEAQLEILERESHYITANVDKIKEEAKKRMQEIEQVQKEGIAIGKFFAKTGKRFSYVKEMIEKKKLEEEEKKLVTAASKTRRLGRYVDRLFREDKEARDTLTASSSAPRAVNLATSTIVNFTYRVGLLLVISFIIIHPKWFLGTIIRLPKAITESVAMYSPEVIVILLLPIMLLFPVISQLISFVKHRNLIVKLQQEGRIKELLISVGDYVKKEEIKEETNAEEEPSTVAAEAT